MDCGRSTPSSELSRCVSGGREELVTGVRSSQNFLTVPDFRSDRGQFLLCCRFMTQSQRLVPPPYKHMLIELCPASHFPQSKKALPSSSKPWVFAHSSSILSSPLS
jgi:hypothetical protein